MNASALDMDALTKKVAPNTELVRVTEKVNALKLHDTFIAWFGREAVLLDVGRWNTRTTWRRIADFTPAHPEGDNLLRYITQPNGDRVLYEPGIRVDYEGFVMNPMFPSRQQAIEERMRSLIANARRYARTVVAGWDDFGEITCNCGSLAEDQPEDHLLRHVDANDPVAPTRRWHDWANAHANFMHPDQVCRGLTKKITTEIVTQLSEHAIWTVDNDFHYLPPNVRSN